MGTAQQLNASALRAFLRYKTTHKQTGAIREQHSTADILSTVFFFNPGVTPERQRVET